MVYKLFFPEKAELPWSPGKSFWRENSNELKCIVPGTLGPRDPGPGHGGVGHHWDVGYGMHFSQPNVTKIFCGSCLNASWLQCDHQHNSGFV